MDGTGLVGVAVSNLVLMVRAVVAEAEHHAKVVDIVQVAQGLEPGAQQLGSLDPLGAQLSAVRPHVHEPAAEL